MFNRLCPPNFGRKKLAIFAKNIAQGKNVTQNFGNRWESSNMQATVNIKIKIVVIGKKYSKSISKFLKKIGRIQYQYQNF